MIPAYFIWELQDKKFVFALPQNVRIYARTIVIPIQFRINARTVVVDSPVNNRWRLATVTNDWTPRKNIREISVRPVLLIILSCCPICYNTSNLMSFFAREILHIVWQVCPWKSWRINVLSIFCIPNEAQHVSSKFPRVDINIFRHALKRNMNFCLWEELLSSYPNYVWNKQAQQTRVL